MSIRKLPTVAEQQAEWATVRLSKPEKKLVATKAQKAAKAREAAKQRDIAWRRAKGHCERCQKPLVRSLDPLVGAHFHHVVKRSQGGSDQASNLACLCVKCHVKEHV